jgi:NAD(P)H-dependent FMN reductase
LARHNAHTPAIDRQLEINMAHIIGISGSLRRHSYNSGLLRAAAMAMPADSSLTIASIADIPLYNGDVEERDGIPPAVSALKDAMAGADGVLLATPEYNNGIPGVFKNTIDWASRPPADAARVFGAKPFAIIGASPGGFGTILAQNDWLPVLRTLGARLWTGGRLMVPAAGKAFDGEGNLIDSTIADRLQRFLADFVATIG